MPKHTGKYIWVRSARKGKGDFVRVEKMMRKRRSDGLQIIKDIEPFLNIAVDNKPVGGRRQMRDMMRAHNLIDVGNEKLTRPATKRYEPQRLKQDIHEAFQRFGH